MLDAQTAGKNRFNGAICIKNDEFCIKMMDFVFKIGKIRFLGASCEGEIARQCIESGNFAVMQVSLVADLSSAGMFY